MNAIDDNAYTKALGQLAATFPRPKAVLVVSAHWLTRGVRVTASLAPRQIYDFGGFPLELYEVKYAPPGDPAVADRTSALLGAAGFPCAKDLDRGMDHAGWTVLLHMYPEADIPLLELSLDPYLDPAAWFAVGAALSPLRDEGILLMGSGNIVHNLYQIDRELDAKPYAWNLTFDAAVRKAVDADDRASLESWAKSTGIARDSVPTPEHFLPLLPIVGARRPGEAVSVFHSSFQNASMSMTGFRME